MLALQASIRVADPTPQSQPVVATGQPRACQLVAAASSRAAIGSPDAKWPILQSSIRVIQPVPARPQDPGLSNTLPSTHACMDQQGGSSPRHSSSLDALAWQGGVAAGTAAKRRRQRLVPAAAVRRAGGAAPAAAVPRCRLQQQQQQQQPPHEPPQQQRLAAAEEAELAAAAAAEDLRAASMLAHANRPLVHYMAAKFAGRGLAKRDLVAEGMLALEHAAQRFQPDRVTSFGAFAATAIGNRMSRALRTQARVVRLPDNHYKDMIRFQLARAELASVLGRQPVCKEIARECGFSVPHTLHLMRAIDGRHSSAEYAAGEEGLTYEIEDPDEDVSAVLHDSMMREDLLSRLTCLPSKLADIVVLRHGLKDGQSRSFAEIGENLKCTAAWAAEQYKQAALRLQQQAAAPVSDAQPLMAAIGSLTSEERLALALRHGWLGDKLSYVQVGKRMNESATWASATCKQAESKLRALLPPAVPLSSQRLESVPLSQRQREVMQQQLRQQFGAGHDRSDDAEPSPARSGSDLLQVMEAIAQQGADLDSEWHQELAAYTARLARPVTARSR